MGPHGADSRCLSGRHVRLRKHGRDEAQDAATRRPSKRVSLAQPTTHAHTHTQPPAVHIAPRPAFPVPSPSSLPTVLTRL